METDWSVAAAADDPLIELPWQDPATTLQFVDLRNQSAEQHVGVGAIPETSSAPALARALLHLNDRKGILATTKCDRWAMDEAELALHADALDEAVEQHGCASYIDVLLTHPVPMGDFLLHEEWARRTALRCAALQHPAARLDLVIRPARFEDVWGFGMSMYIYAAAPDSPQAEAAWAAALEDCSVILRAVVEEAMPAPDTLQPGAFFPEANPSDDD